MGGGHYEDKDGGGSYTPEHITHGDVETHKPDPGKTTKTGVPATGSGIIDEGLACDDDHREGSNANCYWTHDQRTYALIECSRRITQAGEAFQHACDKVEMRTLIEKSEDDIPPVVMFLLTTLGGFLLTKVFDGVMAWKETFKKDPRAAMDAGFAAKKVDKITSPVSLGDKPISEAKSIKNSLKEKGAEFIEKVDAKKLEAKLDPALDKGKEKVNKLREKVAERRTDKDKEEKLDFLDEVSGAGHATFDWMAQKLPAGTSDHELAALIEAFREDAHTIDKYKSEIVSKMDRFKKSQITKIGRNNLTRLEGDHGDMPWIGEIGSVTGSQVTRDVKAEWHNYISGADKELVYVYQDGHADAIPGEQNPDSKNFGQTFNHKFGGMRSSLDEGPRIGAGSKSDDKATVPPEFWESAVTRHLVMWNKEPEKVLIDDSGPAFAHDPKRQQRARDQKATTARALAITQHNADISLANQQAMERAKHMGPQGIPPGGGLTTAGTGVFSGSGTDEPQQDFSPKIPPDQMKKLILGASK